MTEGFGALALALRQVGYCVRLELVKGNGRREEGEGRRNSGIFAQSIRSVGGTERSRGVWAGGL